MADDYLGKKMEEFMNTPSHSSKHRSLSLNKLLSKNRSHRGYDSSFIVREDQLKKIISVNTIIPSARNQQVLRFRPVLSDEAYKVLPYIKLGGALPELSLPYQGTEPNAFIIICSTVAESHFVDIDLGISAQSMLLQATEIGLNGICIGAFNKLKIKEEFKLEYEPVMILAIGKGIEDIELVDIHENESHNYYRENGKHYVPKVILDELIIKR